MKRVVELQAKIYYENVDISTNIEKYLLELTYKDNLKGDTPDTITVKLEDSLRIFQGPLYPVKGAAVAFEFGVNTSDTFKSGKGWRIDQIDVNGGSTGDIVTWVASGQLPSAALHTRMCNAWKNTTLEDVANAISKKHGMELVYECKENIKLLRLDQVNETDLGVVKRLAKEYGLTAELGRIGNNLNVVKRLAKEYGLTCSIKGGKEKPTLVITDLDLVRSKPPAFVINRHDCLSYHFNDRAGLNTKGRYTRWFDPEQKKLIEFEHNRPGGSVKDGLTKGSTEKLEGRGQQDRAIVREALEVHAARVGKAPEASERKADLTLPGNTSLLSGVVLELPEDEWLKNGGVWVIVTSDHKMSVSGGYTTTVNLEKQS
jgi:phage protein D